MTAAVLSSDSYGGSGDGDGEDSDDCGKGKLESLSL